MTLRRTTGLSDSQEGVDLAEVVSQAVGPLARHCVGFMGGPGLGHLMAVTLQTAKRPTQFRNSVLDEICAFDLGEWHSRLRRINAITVSSFASPYCMVVGYDVLTELSPEVLATQRMMVLPRSDGAEVPVYPLRYLTEPAVALLDRYPLLPGSHVPCAMRTITRHGPCVIGGAIAFGIAEGRHTDEADLLMEATWQGPLFASRSWRALWRPWHRQQPPPAPEPRPEPVSDWSQIKEAARAVLAVGEQQHVKYREIFAGATSVNVHRGEVGTVNIMAPYLLLAQQAAGDSPERLLGMSRAEWERDHSANKQVLRLAPGHPPLSGHHRGACRHFLDRRQPGRDPRAGAWRRPDHAPARHHAYDHDRQPVRRLCRRDRVAAGERMIAGADCGALPG